MKPPTAQPAIFKTPESRARYFAAYDATLALWPVAVESWDVPTRFGRTHVHACGPKDGPPLLLVPGQAISSTMWYPNIGALSGAYRVYVPDIVGDMGKSVSDRRMTQPTDFGEWLTDLLDALQVERAHAVGLSYGGFIVLRLALGAPQRVGKLVMLSPASLLAFRPQYFLRMAVALVPFLSLPIKQKVFLGVYSPNTEPAVKQMLTASDFSYMYLPPVHTDAELRQLRPPTLLMMGEHEVIFDPQAVLNRAAALIPGLQTALVPGAGHALSFDQPELVNARILAFLVGKL